MLGVLLLLPGLETGYSRRQMRPEARSKRTAPADSEREEEAWFVVGQEEVAIVDVIS